MTTTNPRGAHVSRIVNEDAATLAPTFTPAAARDLIRFALMDNQDPDELVAAYVAGLADHEARAYDCRPFPDFPRFTMYERGQAAGYAKELTA